MKKRFILMCMLALMLFGAVSYSEPARAMEAEAVSVMGDTVISADVIFPDHLKTDDAEKGEEKSSRKKDKDDDEKGEKSYVKRIIVAAVIGLISAAITISIMKSGMNNVARSRAASDYIVKDSFRLTGNEDRFLRTEVEKKKKN